MSELARIVKGRRRVFVATRTTCSLQHSLPTLFPVHLLLYLSHPLKMADEDRAAKAARAKAMVSCLAGPFVTSM